MKSKILLLLVTFSTISYCQKRYESAYIVTNQNDTLQGQILFEDWDKNPTEFKFKENNSEVEKKFDVENTQSFFITSLNKSYIVKKVSIVIVSELIMYDKEPTQKKEITVFLEKLLSGPKASLYRLKSSEGRTRFFLEHDGTNEELVKFDYQQKIDGKMYRVSNKQYQNQLQSICSDATTFEYTPPLYEEKNLKKFLKKYNACFLGEIVTYENPTKRVSFDVAPTLGIDKWISADEIPRLFFGGSVRVNLPRKNQNQFIKLDLNYIPSLVYYTYDLNLLPRLPISNTGVFQNISLNIGSYFGSKMFRPFVSVGFSHYSIIFNEIKPQSSPFVELNLGLSFKRKIDITLDRILVFDVELTIQPRLTLRYYFNLSKAKK